MKRYLLFFSMVLLTGGCTKLKEEFKGDLTADQVANNAHSADALLNGLYGSLDPAFTNFLTIFPLQEISTDEVIAPTRGGDWDDNGAWRQLHEQNWTPANGHIQGAFNSLGGICFLATDLMRYNPSPQQKAEALFIRAYASYLLLDMFNQVPYRDPGESLTTEARVRKGLEAWQNILDDLESALPDLPDGPASTANKFAAKFLQMKCYLNKAVYMDRGDPAPVPEDMNKVIQLADEIINSGNFKLADQYFDNFSPDNSNIGYENIFTRGGNYGGSDQFQIFFSFLITQHYQEAPFGLNGWTTLSDIYDLFESQDIRRGIPFSQNGFPPNPNNNITAGFQVGQQFDVFSGDSLFDDTGLPLSFTREVDNIETGKNYRITGIRAVKYPPDYANGNPFSPDNDFVFFRFSDVLLMKAEAILRGGTGTSAGSYGSTPLAIVNYIRTHPSRNASSLASIDVDILLQERAREFWWEGWRREDMIRFKKFLLPFQGKNYSADPKYLLYPIPFQQLSSNSNLSQNKGYE